MKRSKSRTNIIAQVSLESFNFILNWWLNCKFEEDQDEKVKQELERQFNEGLSSKIQHKVHCGLGFDDSHSQPQSSNRSSYYNNANKFKQATSSSSQQSSSAASSKDKFAKFKMNFVKSSEWDVRTCLSIDFSVWLQNWCRVISQVYWINFCLIGSL